MLTVPHDVWQRVSTMATVSTVGIRTGTALDALEESTGGHVTAEALDAFFAKLTGESGG